MTPFCKQHKRDGSYTLSFKITLNGTGFEYVSSFEIVHMVQAMCNATRAHRCTLTLDSIFPRL